MSATICFRRLNLWGIHWQSCKKKPVGIWELVVKTNVSQNRCRVFPEKSMVEFVM